MAEFTSLATHFWEDGYIQQLPPTDKLLFVYLISGPQIEPTLGIYELSLRTMAHHTGLTDASIMDSLSRFAAADKIHHVDDWVILKNHFKHNPIKGNSKLWIGLQKRIERVPWTIRDRVEDPSDTLYIPYLDPNHTLYIGPDAPSNPSLARHVTIPVPNTVTLADSRRAVEKSPKAGELEKNRQDLLKRRSM